MLCADAEPAAESAGFLSRLRRGGATIGARIAAIRAGALSDSVESDHRCGLSIGRVFRTRSGVRFA
jgi:hypothetical protein